MEVKKLIVTPEVRNNFEMWAQEAFAPVSCLPPAAIIPYNNDYVETTIELLEDRTGSTAYLATCRTQKGSIFFVFISLCEMENNMPIIRKQFISAEEYTDYSIQLTDSTQGQPRAIL